MAKKTWVYSPPKPSKPRVPDSIKKEVTDKAVELIEAVLKPTIIEIPENRTINYIADFLYKWHQNYFYIIKKYNCPHPNAISPSFEIGLARLEYVGDDSYNLSYMRHTGNWWEIEKKLSLDQCLKLVSKYPLFPG